MSSYKVIKFYSDACAPCKIMEHIADHVCYERGIPLSSYNVSTDEGLKFAKSMGVRQVPAFFLQDSGKTVASKVGAMSEDAFINFVEQQ